MLIRTKNNEYKLTDTSVLLDFLGVKKNAEGIHEVKGDIEMIVPVPFAEALETAPSVPPEAECFAWTLSTFDLDRFGERIDPQGWEYKRYMENPVVEWAHRYDIPAIGKIEGLTSDNEGLHGLVIFNDKSYDPFGWSIGQRVKAGVIRAGSVGFRVMEIEIPDKKTAQDGTTLIFRKQELLEFSICNVPANPFALTKIKNEEGGKRKEKKRIDQGNNAALFWSGVINDFEGAIYGRDVEGN